MMHPDLKLFFLSLILLLSTGTTSLPLFGNILSDNGLPGHDYSDHQQTGERLNYLTDTYPEITALTSLATTRGGKQIRLLTIGAGNTEIRPTIAIVGGVSGNHLLGSELALQFAENLLAMSDQNHIRQLLDSVAFYVFPDMSPDARAQYFSSLRYERLYNNNITDSKRDLDPDDPPFLDLNQDGMITMMRIKDPTGSWIKHPEDERIMVMARREKGEQGRYRLYREGVRADTQGHFDAHDKRGVVFDRNFTFKYPAFQPGAGPHAVSEEETRAVADFLFQSRNVFAVITFGEANNLSEPLKYNEAAASARIHTGWKDDDIKINEMISNLYQKHLEDDLPAPALGQDGDFFQWAYFHYGRFSFSTQGWTVPETEAEKSDPYKSEELRLLQWAEANDIPDVFVPWEPVVHPDFPDQLVEVGGIVPFAMNNPPYHMVDSIASIHTDFIIELSAMRPVVSIVNIEKEKLGRDLHRITARISNNGSFPTASKTGEILRWKQKTVIRTTLDDGLQMISGKPIEVAGVIDGHSAITRSWLIQGRGNVNIRAGAESTGFSEETISL